MGQTDDQRFVEEHAPLVRKIALRVRAELDLTCELDDLIAFGYHGLLEARGRFDETRGVLFSTFAYYRIRGAILDGVRKMAYLPRRIHQKRRAAEAIDWAIEAEGEARATTPEARADVEATLAAVDDILGKITATFMLAAVGQDEEATRESPEEQLIGAHEKQRVRTALETLPERERIVVNGMYFEGRNLDDIGAELGISKSWACRIHTRALGLLREALER
ncbi:sigma-70 family RNA polymerase sigma factor [Sandaracinus amylolyticus]|uniref:RNA polymerase sigma factor for flagellar operon n=1 Tax=Sandaracinus amylolyticus TaxID=927083 RepID=A0A0F6YK68_9BACT|nr:sigma-70 family RNA polymerase sigma factor [Sandaracinus amylolyticus]AKF06926.1 RNA polymerase sigma factor for flagellar operon [Sandaracinus amylolyticus]